MYSSPLLQLRRNQLFQEFGQMVQEVGLDEEEMGGAAGGPAPAGGMGTSWNRK